MQRNDNFDNRATFQLNFVGKIPNKWLLVAFLMVIMIHIKME